MTTLLSWPVAATLAAGVGTLLLLRALWRVRDRPGARWLLVTLAAQAVACLAYAGALLTPDRTLRYGFEVLAVVGLHWLGAPFLAFALAYTGRQGMVQSWYFRAQFALPVLATVLVPLNGLHRLFWSGFEPVRTAGVVGATYTVEPLLFVTILGGLAGATVAALLLVETVLSYGPLYRSEALAVALSPLPPAVGVFAWLFGIGPFPALNLAFPLFLPHVLLDGHAFVRSGMFDFHPATNRAAERSALDDLDSPVFVVDGEGRVADLNSAAGTLVDGNGPRGEPVEAVLGTEISLTEDQQVGFQVGGQYREFRLRPTTLTDSGDNRVGHLLVFQDVTEELRREQRLEVLNRVLRHNLRNSLSVVKGGVSVAREQAEDDFVASNLELAEAEAADLIATTEKARTVASQFRDIEDTSTVDVCTLCEHIAERYRRDDVTVSVTCVDGTEVTTNDTLLSVVVENLVENAIEHGTPSTDTEADHDDGDPTVTVTVERGDGGTVQIAVSDDGPGIPDIELDAVRAGEETALKHGSGIGLYAIKWGTELLGGEATFDTGADGTTVTVTVPGQ